MTTGGFKRKLSAILSADVVGYIIHDKQSAFARKLLDNAGNNIILKHFSHHVKATEVNKGKIILYGL